jgi:hypothetical protein
MTDYGALATRDRKGRIILPPDLMATDRPDPDAPNRTVRGVQRVDYLARILGPDRRQWTAQDRLRFWAAELYRDDHAIGEDGANPNPSDSLPTLRQGGPGGYGPTDGRVDALGRLRAATAVLPLVSVVVVRDVVLRAIPMGKVVARSGKRHASVRHSLMVGLDALAVHYEAVGR